MTTVIIIDDHVLFREGLKCLIEAEPRLQIVGEAGDGRTGIKLVERLKPTVVLLGLILAVGPHGLEVLRQLRSKSKLLALSMRSDEAFVAEAILSGADGYVVRGDGFHELLKAIEAVMENRRFISAGLNKQRITGLLARGRAGAATVRERLTPREHEVLQLAAEGLTSAETGDRLSISPRTVEMHRGNLMRKLGLRSTVDLVRYAIRNRVIPA